jgi:hypothetical protein
MSLDNVAALNARDDLLYVAHRWRDLRAALAGLTGNALTGVVVDGGAEPVPIDLYVSDLMHQVTEDARFYGRVLLDEVPAEHGCDEPEGHATRDCPRRIDPVQTSVMPSLLRDVAERYGHFTSADDRTALDFADTWHEYARKVRLALEKPEPADYLGPCPNPDHEGAGCTGQLRLRKDRERGWCGVCGSEFTRESQVAYLTAEMESVLLTASELTSALHIALGHEVPFSTVKSWIKRKRIVAHGKTRDDNPERGDLFSFDDALALARGRRERMGA